jgi:N-methylhydantoinase A/oxoprolinase/acetone carboxylase beta subunit
MPSDMKITAPAVIESLESTILVPPGWKATMNEDGFVVMSRSDK